MSFVLAEQGKAVLGLGPVDVGGAAKTSDYFSMANYSHASIIVAFGVIGNTTTITVEESTNNAGGATTAIGFDYYSIHPTTGATGARTTATSTGFASGTTNNSMFVIEIDAEQLTDGYPYLVVKTDNAAASLVAIIPVLSGARYAQAAPPIAI